MASKCGDYKLEQAYVKIRTLLRISAKEIHNELLEVYTDDAHPYSTIVDWAYVFVKEDSIEDGAKIGRSISEASDRVIF